MWENLPHGVLIGVWELGTGHRGAVIRPHDSLGQQKVAEEAGHEEVLAEQLLEEFCQQHTTTCDNQVDTVLIWCKNINNCCPCDV